MLGGFIASFNDNKYIYAVMMILFNIGAKYIEFDLNKDQIKFLSSTALRRIIIFTMAFIATKDIIASLIITACFVIIVLNLFNTSSKYCILPTNISDIDEDGDGYISPEEIEKAYNLLKKAGKI